MQNEMWNKFEFCQTTLTSSHFKGAPRNSKLYLPLPTTVVQEIQCHGFSPKMLSYLFSVLFNTKYGSDHVFNDFIFVSMQKKI